MTAIEPSLQPYPTMSYHTKVTMSEAEQTLPAHKRHLIDTIIEERLADDLRKLRKERDAHASLRDQAACAAEQVQIRAAALARIRKALEEA